MKRNEENIKLINEYISRLKDENIVLSDNWFKGLSASKGTIPAYEISFLSRAVYYALRKKYVDVDKLYSKAELFLALEDTVKFLAAKGVKFYFVQRVSEKKDFEYSEMAKVRMTNSLGFPTMCEDYDKYSEDFKQLVGEKASEEYIKVLASVPQIVFKGDKYAHEDYRSSAINIFAGMRVVPHAPANADTKIHIYGRCGVFGYAVDDSETMPDYLQQQYNNAGEEVKVINHGLWGGDDSCIIHNFICDSEKMNEGDTVVFYLKKFDSGIMDSLVKCGVRYSDITEKWHEYDEAKWCFYDRPGHMNRNGYKNVAELIYKFIKENEDAPTSLQVQGADYGYRTRYLENSGDEQFDKSVAEYIEGIRKEIGDAKLPEKCGSIVMNCNPFTNGHRYLIEYAASKVDWLWIFVVEEDRSVFKFEDRFEMVKKGCADLANVHVVPSGKFIISTLTFPEYFMKDYVKEKNFDISNDLTIFATKIAPGLNVKVRFAGEEPMDPVTANYNENMAVILPKYGIEFCEIPRLKLTEDEVINATKVRTLMKEGDVEGLAKYIPETTLEVVKEKYM